MEFEITGSKQEIYTKVKDIIQKIVGSGKMPFVKDVKMDDSACMVEATGNGFGLKIKCLDGKVNVDLQLGLLLKTMRGTIEGKIKHYIESGLK